MLSNGGVGMKKAFAQMVLELLKGESPLKIQKRYLKEARSRGD